MVVGQLESPSEDGIRRVLAIGLTVLALGLYAAKIILDLVVADAAGPTSGPSIFDALTPVPLLAFALVGGLVASRRPANPVGWICLASGLGWCLLFFNNTYVEFGQVVLHRTAPLSDWLGLPGWAVPLGLFSTFLLLYFPNGLLPSPRWRYVAWLSGFTIVVPSIVVALLPDEEGRLVNVPDIFEPLRGLAATLEPLVLLTPLCFVASAISLVMRYRGAGVDERERIKWIAYAGSIVAGFYVITFIGSIRTDWGGSQTPPLLSAMQTVSFLAFGLIPVAVGFAVLRYRLYDIDRLIARTLSYAIVTGVLVGAYLSVVILAALALPGRAGRGEWVTAAGTLSAAFLFAPVRKRVQSAVDRRFNRSRYDAARTVEEFASRLRSRVELEDVQSSLEDVVATTMAPSRVWLWVPEGRPKRSR